MSEEPRESSQGRFFNHKEQSMTQVDQQKTPQESTFLSPKEPQETSSPYSYSHGGMSAGGLQSMLDLHRYGKMKMIPTPGHVSSGTKNKHNNEKPYLGPEASYDSRGFLIDLGTSVTSSSGSSLQVYASGKGYDINNYNPLGHQSGGNISYMTSQRNSGGLLEVSGSQRKIGGFADSGTLFTDSTASLQQTYHNFGSPEMQGNFALGFGGNNATTQKNNRQSNLGTKASYNGSGLLGNSATSFASSTRNTLQDYGNHEYLGKQGEGYDINNYNPYGHQTGGNIPYMTSQRNSGGLLGDSVGGDGTTSYNAFESHSHFSNIASMNPHMTPTPGNVNNNSNIKQSHSSGGLSPAHMMHNDGPTTSVGTRMANTTNTTSSQSMSQEERRKWTIKKRLSKTDVNPVMGRLRLTKTEVERHIRKHISEADFDKRAQSEQGIEIEVYDHDTSTPHSMSLAFREGYYIMGNWRVYFIERRELKIGDEIGLCWDTSRSRLKFSVLSRPKAQ